MMINELDAKLIERFHSDLLSSVRGASVNTFPFPHITGKIEGEAFYKLMPVLRAIFPLAQNDAINKLSNDLEVLRVLVHLPDLSTEQHAKEWFNILTESFEKSLSRVLLLKFLSFIPSYSRIRVIKKIFSSFFKSSNSNFLFLSSEEKSELLKGQLECDWMFTCDHFGYELKPHTDAPRKMITFLLYLTESDIGFEVPGTSIYKPISNRNNAWDSYRVDSDEFHEVLRTKHVEGVFFAFAKSDISWHGVEKGSWSSILRKSINLTIQRPKGLLGR